MEESFTIPARPWGEADVKFLTANAHLLDEETKAELGLTRPEPINDFKAELDVTPDAPAPVVDGPETIVVTQEILDENPVLAEAGVQVGDVGVATDEVPEGVMLEETTVGLPTDAEGAVVDNTTTDNA